MRWGKPEVNHIHGEVKHEIVFAWLPTRLSDDSAVWLEHYIKRLQWNKEAHSWEVVSCKPIADGY